MKSWRLWTAATQHIAAPVVIINILVKSRSLETIQTKITKWKLRPGFIESVHEIQWQVQHLSCPLALNYAVFILNTKCIWVIWRILKRFCIHYLFDCCYLEVNEIKLKYEQFLDIGFILLSSEPNYQSFGYRIHVSDVTGFKVID